MKVKANSSVEIADLLDRLGTALVSVNMDQALSNALENPLSTFTDEELVAELLRRTSLGKELE